MEADKKIKPGSAELLTAHSETVEEALKKGIRYALRKHQQANNPVAVWRDGKVVLIAPDEILPENI